MQSGSSGWHGSFGTIAPRLAPAAGVEPPPAETDGLAPALLGAGVDVRPSGCIEVPIAGSNDAGLVDAPIVGAVDVPTAGPGEVPIVEVVVVPIGVDDVVPNICEPLVESDPVVPSEVSAGSLAAAEGPIPNLAAKELKSVAAPRPRVSWNASNSGSDAAGVMTTLTIGGVNVLVLGTVDVVVVVPVAPNVVPELNVENCACATQGVAISATGAIHPMIPFISPPREIPTLKPTTAARV